MLSTVVRSFRSLVASPAGLVLALAAGLLAAPAARAQFVLTSTLGHTTSVTFGLSESHWYAAPFTTDSTHTTIESVTFLVNGSAPAPVNTVRIFSNTLSQPGTDLGLGFTGNTGVGESTFELISGSALAPDTEYWAVLSSDGLTNANSGSLSSSNATGTGPGFISAQALGTTNSGASWGTLTGGMGSAYGIFAVSASASSVPEPATNAALAGVLALGFTAYRRRRIV